MDRTLLTIPTLVHRRHAMMLDQAESVDTVKGIQRDEHCERSREDKHHSEPLLVPRPSIKVDQ